MSKVFEALQRLERETGKLLTGVSTEAQRVLQTGAVILHTTAPEQEGQTAEPPVNPAPPATFSDEVDSKKIERGFRLAEIPVENATITPATRVVYYTDPDSPAADRFRLLRMRLWPLWESGKLKSLLVTSAQAQDGKSTIALNLATALVEQGKKRVLLIEGDLYRSSLVQRLGLSDGPGLAECLEAALDPLSALRRVEPLGLYLLAAGRPQGNPTELLQSPILSNVFDALRPYFDWIVVDTPPVLPLTDTLSFRDRVDAALLIVRADRTPRDAVEAAIGRVGKQHLLGIVLNGSAEIDRLYSDYRNNYGPERGKGKKRSA